MSFEGPSPAADVETKLYPGEMASAEEVLELADAFCAAADQLFEAGLRGNPFRFSAIHAIELYLNAALLYRGMPADEIRGHFHDLSIRAAFLRLDKGIPLKEATRTHLVNLTQRREYLWSRYELEVPAGFSQPTRLQATLHDVAAKIGKALKTTTK